MIPDIVPLTATVIFVLESPHVEELQHGYPASGSSGREMSRVILGRTDIPLSLIIKCPCISNCLSIPSMSHAGIMNVSNFPLQESCYSGQFASLKPQNMDALKYVRNDLQKKKRESKKTFQESENELAQNEIFQNFKQRLDYVINRNNVSKIVPCGHFAAYFVYRYKSGRQNMSNIRILKDIPHPSGTSGGWNSLSPATISSLQKLQAP